MNRREAFERLQLGWTRDYGGSSASTADFMALASRVARRDLTAFLQAWLYGTTTPPIPNHPDWVVLPIPAPTAKQAIGTAGRSAQADRR